MADISSARRAQTPRLGRRWNQFLDWYHAKRSRGARKVTAFVSQPEPRSIGSFARGRQLVAGNFLFAGYLVVAPKTSIWDIKSPDATFEARLHGFGWLDDLAAVGDLESRHLSQLWTQQWIERFGSGRGRGWTSELTGRRLIRWINHAVFLMNGPPKETVDEYFKSLAQQAYFLSRRWHAAPPGLQRFEALIGLLYAGLSLEGHSELVNPTMRAIGNECERRVGATGDIPSRNPEELMEVFNLLTWAGSVLEEVDRKPHPDHIDAVHRIVPTLRALRHTDGALARFHGGGHGLEGRLDQALAISGVRATAGPKLAMGFLRLSAGRSSVIVDVAAPPNADESPDGHASTLAFELTSGRRPIVVNCGPGALFGPEWQRVGRATASHSTLGITGSSSSRFVPAGESPSGIGDGPDAVAVKHNSDHTGSNVLVSHNGYRFSHGLMHVRKLDLSLDGRFVGGEDMLGAISDDDNRRVDVIKRQLGIDEIGFAVRFHIHPDVEPELDLGGKAVSLTLKSGEVWVFRHQGAARLSLEPSFYLARGRLKPRATKQIVLTDDVLDYAAQVSWSFSKAQDGRTSLRDLESEKSLTDY